MTDEWMSAVIDRHTRTLTKPEFLKAVRALSARYVERRAELVRRQPTDSAGKRAAFAGFFAPLHFLTTREIVRVLDAARVAPDRLIDLGCGTGTVSAAWAIACATRPALLGVDRQGWALQEAAWNWRMLSLQGRTRRADLVSAAEALVEDHSNRGRTAIALGWSVNELDASSRRRLLPILLALSAREWPVLVIEPLAHAVTPWWDEWAHAATTAGGQVGEWKFDVALPPALADLDDAAGFRRDTLGARSIWLGATR